LSLLITLLGLGSSTTIPATLFQRSLFQMVNGT
jgi:hypothetical protein